MVVEGPFEPASPEAPGLSPEEAEGLVRQIAERHGANGILRRLGAIPKTHLDNAAAGFAREMPAELPPAETESAPALRPASKRGRTALLAAITLLGVAGLLAAAWAWDVFGLRSRWAPPPPPAVLNWRTAERVEGSLLGGALPDKEREAGKTLLVVEVQLPRRLLDNNMGWQDWSVAFDGAHLSLTTPDGLTARPALLTSLDTEPGPGMPAWPAGFPNDDMWFPGSHSCRLRSQGPCPERFRVKAVFVVLEASVKAGGLRVTYKGVPSAPFPQKQPFTGRG